MVGYVNVVSELAKVMLEWQGFKYNGYVDIFDGGLILIVDVVDVYVLDRKLQLTEESTLHLDTMREMEMKLYTNCRENADMEYLTTAEIARRLPQYDNILPYWL